MIRPWRRDVQATHTLRHANQWWPGWSADIVSIRKEALVSRGQAREYEGLG
jgi:hypothetical protein